MRTRSAIAAAGKKFRTKNISRRAQKIVISPIKEMSILADQFGQKDLISFGQGIPYFDTPSHIKKAIQKSLREIDTAKYTLEPGITELRELVAKKYKVNKNQVMITVGCQEAMACALASISDPGDQILIPSPTFASHIEQILQFNGQPRFVPLMETQGWKININKFKEAINKKTKAILFSNPSNPTGSVLTKKTIEQLINLARENNLIIIADETYDFLTYDNVKHYTLANYKNTIVCSSFSKKYALTGYRVGYAISEESIIDHMLKIHDALAICAPAISQKAAIAALKGPQNSVKSFVNKLTYNRNLMCQELDKMSEVFEYQKPMGAYYILARYKKPKINSFELALAILKKARVITIPGAAFGPTGENHLRFSFAGEPKQIPEGFKRLRKFFRF